MAAFQHSFLRNLTRERSYVTFLSVESNHKSMLTLREHHQGLVLTKNASFVYILYTPYSTIIHISEFFNYTCNTTYIYTFKILLPRLWWCLHKPALTQVNIIVYRHTHAVCALCLNKAIFKILYYKVFYVSKQKSLGRKCIELSTAIIVRGELRCMWQVFVRITEFVFYMFL